MSIPLVFIGVAILAALSVAMVIFMRFNDVMRKLNHMDRRLDTIKFTQDKLFLEVTPPSVGSEPTPIKSKPKKKATKPRNWRTAVDRAGRRMYDDNGNKIPVKNRVKE